MSTTDHPPDAAAGPPAAPPRRHRRRYLWWLVGAVVVVWVLVAGFQVLRGVRAADHGIADIDQAKAHLTASEVTGAANVSVLRRAHSQFVAARADLESPALAPVDVLPVIGRQLRSLQALSGAAAHVARVGANALHQARAILDTHVGAGPARISALESLAALARHTDADISHLDTGPSVALLGPVAAKRDKFVDELDHVRSELAHAATTASAAAGILQGPRTYLVLMGNNAEMRAASGGFLEAGIVTFSDGEAHLSDVQQTANLALAPGQVPVGGDLEADWGWLMPGVDWRNIGVDPQFDVDGPLAASMWAATTGQHVDGVLAVDIEALAQVLSVIGPVTLPDGSQVGAQNVVSFLEHAQYAQAAASGLSASQLQGEEARQEQQGELAGLVFQALENQPLDLPDLAGALAASTEGRHLMLWSADPSVESAWSADGVAGRLGANSMLVGLVNRGGNKLDQYTTLSVSLRAGGPGHEDVTLTVDIHNATPAGQVQEIAGPYPGLGTTYGEYVGVLTVNLPGAVSRPSVSGALSLDALGGEGPTWLVAANIEVPAGGSAQVVVHFDRRRAPDPTVVPSARIPPVAWATPGGAHDDGAPFTLKW